MGARASLLELYNSAAPQPAQLTAGGAISTGSANITMAATIPAWVVAGMPVWDVTTGQLLGAVSSGAGTTTLVLAAVALHNGSGSADVLQFGLTPPDIAACYAGPGGTDIRGLIQVAQLKCTEAIALLNFISNDLITSGQDAAANTIIAAAITSLS
jgi:hypothetical protein